MDQERRTFIKALSCVAGIPLISPVVRVFEGLDGGRERRVILLRSSWQTVNIGDIGHTFGIMELFEKHLPDAEVILWPVSINNGVDALLKKSFPQLKIVTGKIDAHGRPDTSQLASAFSRSAIMVHGSGPWVAAASDLVAWRKLTGKPFGIYGVSLETADADLRRLLDDASFFYARDTLSLKFVRSLGLKCPVVDFAPDATFAIRLHNPGKAATYLKSSGLKSGEFICAIPRLRYTPYFQIKNTEPTAEDKRRYAISLQYKEADAAKLREVMIRWVRETRLKVLACPEMTYQVALAKEVLVDPLPGDVKKNVVWRDSYWTPDEAGSVYAHARALVSFEMHSPIIAFAEGVPAIHLKQPTDTTKGQMWRDIGLGDWLFEIDETSSDKIGDALMMIHDNYGGALDKLKAAEQKVKTLQQGSMAIIKKVCRA